MDREIGTVKIDMAKEVGRLTLRTKIVGRRRWRLRLWLGCKVLALASRIIGTKSEVSIEGGD